jgi:hypothetical protein
MLARTFVINLLDEFRSEMGLKSFTLLRLSIFGTSII